MAKLKDLEFANPIEEDGFKKGQDQDERLQAAEEGSVEHIGEDVGIRLSNIKLRSLVKTINLLHRFFLNLICLIPLDVSRLDDVVPDTPNRYAKFKDEVDRI